MAKFQIPTNDKKFIQPNKGDVFGNIFGTFNLDFDYFPGRVRVSRRTLILNDSTDDADLGVPWAFVRSSADGTDRWWAGCNAVLFKNTAGAGPVSSNFVQDSLTSASTSLSLVSSDLVDFNGKLIVSYSTDLDMLNSASQWTQNWWTGAGNLNQATLTSGIAHPLHITKKTNLTLLGDGNLVHTIDKNNNVKNSRIILPTEFEVIWIRSTPDGSWIGARNKLMREAQVFFWDEYSENYNRSYGQKHDMTFAGVAKNGIIHSINGSGQLLAYDGNGFRELSVLPIFEKTNKRLNDGNTIIRSIHRNGMAVIDEQIHILLTSFVNNDETKSLENFPSGIWTFNETQGLRHKYGLTLERATAGSEMDYGQYILPLVGALVPTENSNGLFLAGASAGTSATQTIKAIWYGDPNEQRNHRGHFITSVLESSGFEDTFQDILLSFKRFKNSSDRIIIKYRNIKNPNYPISGTGTWTSTSVFTTTVDLSNAAIGDEVMVIRGKGSGATPHILTSTLNGGTYTVVLDETITGVGSGTFIFQIGDWTKAATISSQSIEREGFDLDVPGTFIQFKIELRSVPGGSSVTADSPELEKIVINSIPENAI